MAFFLYRDAGYEVEKLDKGHTLIHKKTAMGSHRPLPLLRLWTGTLLAVLFTYAYQILSYISDR